MENFTKWFRDEKKRRGWSNADMARHSGLTRQAIGNYDDGRIPDAAALVAIAKAFKYPPEAVLRRAGILPPVPRRVELLEEMALLMADLSLDEQMLLIRIGRTSLGQQELLKTG